MNNKYVQAIEQIKQGIINYVDTKINKAPMDKTFTCIVKVVEGNGLYTILLNGVIYPHVTTIGGSCVVNETVKVLAPQNNFTNLVILKSDSKVMFSIGTRESIIQEEYIKCVKCNGIAYFYGKVLTSGALTKNIWTNIFTITDTELMGNHIPLSCEMLDSGGNLISGYAHINGDTNKLTVYPNMDNARWIIFSGQYVI